jgi:hypothetical protein
MTEISAIPFDPLTERPLATAPSATRLLIYTKFFPIFTAVISTGTPQKIPLVDSGYRLSTLEVYVRSAIKYCQENNLLVSNIAQKIKVVKLRDGIGLIPNPKAFLKGDILQQVDGTHKVIGDTPTLSEYKVPTFDADLSKFLSSPQETVFNKTGLTIDELKKATETFSKHKDRVEYTIQGMDGIFAIILK